MPLLELVRVRSARSAHSREKLLEKMERVERPAAEAARLRLHFTPLDQGRAYGENRLLPPGPPRP